MTSTDSNLKTVAQVDVQSAWASKINWTQAVGGAAMILTFMTGGKAGLDVNQQAAIVTVIGLLQGAVTWFTKTVTAASAAGPDVPTKTIVKILLVAFVLSAFLVPSAFAQAPKLKLNLPIDPLHLNGTQVTGDPNKDLQALWQKIVTASDTDLVYASALAGAAGTDSSAVRKQCWDKIISINKQANGANLKNADGTQMVKPDAHLFTDVETFAEVVDNLQPGGPLWVACSGAAQLAKTNTLAFINAVVTGAAGIAALPAGL